MATQRVRKMILEVTGRIFQSVSFWLAVLSAYTYLVDGLYNITYIIYPLLTLL
jgi:hypothetical protein